MVKVATTTKNFMIFFTFFMNNVKNTLAKRQFLFYYIIIGLSLSKLDVGQGYAACEALPSNNR